VEVRTTAAKRAATDKALEDLKRLIASSNIISLYQRPAVQRVLAQEGLTPILAVAA
jgi:hypothetical protein